MVEVLLEHSVVLATVLGLGLVIFAIISGSISYFPSKNQNSNVKQINDILLIAYLVDISLISLLWEYEALQEYDNLTANPISFTFFLRVVFLSIPGVLVFKFNTFMEPRMRKSWEETEEAFSNAKQLNITQKVKDSLKNPNKN